VTEPIRVAYFIQDLTTGGAESHLARLLPALDRDRIAPELIVFHERGELLDVIRDSGVEVHELGYQPGLAGVLGLRSRLRSLLARTRPDVLHAYGFPCDVFAAIFPIPRGRMRVVTSRRGNQPVRRRHYYYRLANNFVDRVVCVSQATKSFAVKTEGLSRKRSAVIPNGIDLAGFPETTPVPDTLRVIGTLGRLRPVKGSDLLLDAFARLDRPDATLKMGGPADRAWGAALRERHTADKGVEFLDDVDALSFLPTLDLFVLPSRSEGMSNALLEAMALGLPIVATDVGGNREVLADGEAGLLVEPDAGAIATGIRSLLDDPEKARGLARAARNRVENEYTLARMVSRYHEFYKALLT